MRFQDAFIVLTDGNANHNVQGMYPHTPERPIAGPDVRDVQNLR